MPKRLQKKSASKAKSKKAKPELVTIYPRIAKKVPAALAKQLNEAYEHGRQDAYQDVRQNPPTLAPPTPDDTLLSLRLSFREDCRELLVSISHDAGPIAVEAYAKAVESVAGIIRKNGLPLSKGTTAQPSPTLPIIAGAH